VVWGPVAVSVADGSSYEKRMRRQCKILVDEAAAALTEAQGHEIGSDRLWYLLWPMHGQLQCEVYSSRTYFICLIVVQRDIMRGLC
jgi:hypothetical protein